MIVLQPLSPVAFAPFGDVIEARDDVARFLINDGEAERFDDLAAIDTLHDGGRPAIAIVRALSAADFPLTIARLERHPNGSQAFVPLQAAPFVVVVAPFDGQVLDGSKIRAFRSNGRQGVNFRRGVWHHPLIAAHVGAEFLVIDRRGPEPNLELAFLDPQARVMT